MSADRDPLVVVRDLKQHYPVTQGLLKREIGRVRAVDGVSFAVGRGETLGLVGESGCGKSTVGTSILRLEEPTAGQVLFDGEDVTAYDRDELKRFRRRAQLIFQDPTSSFDPRMTVGESVGEPLLIHGLRDRTRRRRIVENLFERVGLSADDADRYPHEFSGGQKQRIALARALVVNPEFIVADEPISALDVSVQAEILSLIEAVQAEFGLSILFISHDLAAVREVCDRVAVMYLGEIVEVAPTERLFDEPRHPYTRALLSAIPRPDPRRRGQGIELTGDVPDPADPPSGCRFHTRCPEIIGPEGYDLDRTEWRRVMDLREWLGERGIEVPDVREFVVADGAVDPATATDDRLETAVRNEFDVPAPLSDPRAERILADALADIVEGDFDAAEARLAAEFATPCESHHPEFHELADGHRSLCHLHDPQYAPADPEEVPQRED